MNPAPPFFTIIIPTWNRPEQLGVCLGSVALLEYPRDCFEVIVVDDGGDCPLGPLLEAFRGRLDLTLCRQENAGPAAARNRGAGLAKGEFLLFTDDDCTLVPDYLGVAAGYLADAADCLLGGRTLNAVADSLFSATSQLIIDRVYHHYNRDPLHARFFASNNMVLPAGKFDELGGFDSGFRAAEDRELCDRWLQRGYPMIHAPEAVIHHAHRLNLVGFCRQHFHYGRGAYRYHRLRAQRGAGSMATEIGFHLDLRNWLLHPFRRMGVLRGLPLAGGLLLWQLVNGLGFLYQAVRCRFDRPEGG